MNNIDLIKKNVAFSETKEICASFKVTAGIEKQTKIAEAECRCAEAKYSKIRV